MGYQFFGYEGEEKKTDFSHYFNENSMNKK